jgi:hypothetical protein
MAVRVQARAVRSHAADRSPSNRLTRKLGLGGRDEQALAASAGLSQGYLSAFPESNFDRLEAGQPVWSPYYVIHKYLAG